MTTFAQTPDGYLWLGTLGGLVRFDGAAFTVYDRESTQGLTSSIIRALHVDRAGMLWVGTENGGVSRFDGQRFTTFTRAEGLPSNTVLAFAEDRDGTLWIGTRGGVVRMAGGRVIGSQAPRLPAAAVQDIHALRATGEGVLWIATYRGLIRLEDGAASLFTTRQGLSRDNIIALFEDREGNLWAGTDRGLNRLKEALFEVFTAADGLADDVARAVYEDRDGAVWVGTDCGGLSRLQHGRFATFDAGSGLSDPCVWSITQTRDGTLWIGTRSGLNRFREGHFTAYTTADGLADNFILALHEDRGGALWIGTQGGLSLLRDGRITAFSTQEGLADNRISAILEDDQGFLWTGGHRGIQRINKQSLRAFAAGQRDRVLSTLYGRGDGLKNPECTGGFQPAAWRSQDGRLWFPTVEGIAVVEPMQAAAGSAPPPVLVEQVLVGGDPIQAQTPVVLPRRDRSIEIRYTSPSLLSSDRVRFRFMLQDLDEGWVEAGPRRAAYYQQVPPGTYTFLVEASYDGLDWSEEQASVAVRVPPAFYETRWFWALCLFVVLAAAFSALRLNARRLVRRADALERIVATRTLDLQREKEQAQEAYSSAEEAHRVAQKALATVEEQAVQLLQLDHLKNRFYADVSHEFRTPLTLVINSVESALQAAPGTLEEGAVAQLQAARRNARRMILLVNQLLDLARLEAGGMELRAQQEDIVAFLRTTVEMFSSEAERRQIALLFTPVPDSLLAYVDRDKLEKILFNLLSNAFKATPVGGKVVVSVQEMQSENAPGFAEISVRDTGIGIPPERLPHIFDRFYQVESPSRPQLSGTGIGLFLTKELVELHGGRIDVESVPGFGSAFTMYLPLGSTHLPAPTTPQPEQAAGPSALTESFLEALPAPDAYPNAPPEMAPSPGASERDRPLVLVVDDNTEMRASLRGFLAPTYQVVEAQNGLEGIRTARARHPDLIVSDVVMPEMEGVAFCRLVRQDARLWHIPIILLTAIATDAHRLESLQAGADDYLTKPFSAQELLARAENLIRSRRALRDQFSQEVVLRPSDVAVQPAEAAFLERVRSVVELHLEDASFTVKGLAAEAGISEAQLKRRLRALIDQSPVEFIRAMRLERAAQLLRQRAGNISEVAFATGFNNLSYFARCFRERFGVTPSQYPAPPTRGVPPDTEN